MRSPERNEFEQPDSTITKRVGHALLGISAVYIGLKFGEDYLHFVLPDYVEIAIAGGVGAAAMNGRFASE